jgi:hypothetical protein
MTRAKLPTALHTRIRVFDNQRSTKGVAMTVTGRTLEGVVVAVVVGAFVAVWPSGARAEFCWDYVQRTNSSAPFGCVQDGDHSKSCGSVPNFGGNGLTCHYPDPNGDPAKNYIDLSKCCEGVPQVLFCKKMRNGTAVSCTSDADCGAEGPCLVPKIEAVHSTWHQCFGPQGTTAGSGAPALPPALLPNGNVNPLGGRINPPRRGAHWYAFHRQLTLDFDSDPGRGGGLAKPTNDFHRIEWVPWGKDPQTAQPQHLTHDFPSSPPTPNTGSACMTTANCPLGQQCMSSRLVAARSTTARRAPPA